MNHMTMMMLAVAALAGNLTATGVEARAEQNSGDHGGSSGASGFGGDHIADPSVDRTGSVRRGFAEDHRGDRHVHPHLGRVNHDNNDDFPGCLPARYAHTSTGWRWICA